MNVLKNKFRDRKQTFLDNLLPVQPNNIFPIKPMENANARQNRRFWSGTKSPILETRQNRR